MNSHRDDSFLRELNRELDEEARRLNAAWLTLDLYFLVYLRKVSRFGYFSLGPVTIDVRLIEDIVEQTIPLGATTNDMPPFADDLVRFSQRLMEEVRRSGRRRIDELHFLLAFMRTPEGLPQRVFGELGVTPEQVEEYLRGGGLAQPTLEKLYTPEEAAQYLNVHVQTVRAWVRSGRLRARRLAGQRALRITASDLQSVLEAVDPDEFQDGT
ncbi:MAG TPA: helix-turn-helix domain-containing protein [Dehalococcoidia bacterium]|nr:helix-turn-helix domain-containing protein [Dehalococcoidia bacterium]